MNLAATRFAPMMLYSSTSVFSQKCVRSSLRSKNLIFHQTAAALGASMAGGAGATFSMSTSAGASTDKGSPVGQDTPFLVKHKQATVFAPSSNKEPRPAVFTENGERFLQLKVAPEDTAFRMCLFEERVPAGGGTPIHVHLMEDEFFTFVEGTFKVVAGKDVLDVKAGETVFVPRGTPHAWCNVGNTPGKLYLPHTRDTNSFKTLANPASTKQRPRRK
jgi:mannose-6-phosphate isomerase-like protein (cupin superfamily)